MLSEKLKSYRIILASGSPRRQEFFRQLDIPFEVQLKEIDEVYPENLQAAEISDYLAKLKAIAFTELHPKDILITSDTIVWFENKALGKPKDEKDAVRMLRLLSGSKHEVITSVCFTTPEKQITINDKSSVWFKPFSEEEIAYYIANFKPFDKAGAYGIQDWIGMIGVTKITGSYNNIMGFPTHLVYKTLSRF